MTNDPVSKRCLVLAPQERALLGKIHRRDGQILVGRDRPIDRDAETVSDVAAVSFRRHQQAALALHGRIRRRPVRHVGDGDVEKLEARILVVDHLLDAVVDDPLGVDLPQSRPGGIVLTGVAGRVGAVIENCFLAVRVAAPLGVGRAEMRVVGGVGLQALDEAVLEVVGEVEAFGVLHRAIRLGQAGVAFGADTSRVTIVGDAIGFEQAALVINLHVSTGRDGILRLVVDELAGLDDHAGLGRRFFAPRRRGDENRRTDKNEGRETRNRPAEAARWPRVTPDRRREPREGARRSHQPSSE